MKLLKEICRAPEVKSYFLKKVLCDLRRKEGDNFAADIFEYKIRKFECVSA